ncbi:MAG: hypothetical protein J6C46_12100 [Clostridia bacterium]|nr:hypothetical protein [Clostridia bacterium]
MIKRVVNLLNNILSKLDIIAIGGLAFLFVIILLDKYTELNIDTMMLGNSIFFLISTWLIWVFVFGRRLITIWSSKVRKKLKNVNFKVEKKKCFIGPMIALTLMYALILLFKHNQIIEFGYNGGVLGVICELYTWFYIPCMILLFVRKKAVLPDITQEVKNNFDLIDDSISNTCDGMISLKSKEYTFSYRIKEEQVSMKDYFPLSFRRRNIKFRVIKIESEIKLGKEYIEIAMNKIIKLKKEHKYIKFDILSKGDELVLKMRNAVSFSKMANAKYVVGLIFSMCTIAEEIVENVSSVIDEKIS